MLSAEEALARRKHGRRPTEWERQVPFLGITPTARLEHRLAVGGGQMVFGVRETEMPMSSRWTREQVRAMRQKPVPDELMKDMLDTNRADGWMLRLALEADDDGEEPEADNGR